MIHINNYLHRAEFYDLVRRWMYNDVISSDAGRITRLVNFNNAFIARLLHQFSMLLFRDLHGVEPRHSPVRRKSVLKDAICENPPYYNQRIEQLVSDYYAHPEHYYRETPYHGSLFFCEKDGEMRYVGSNRIKRVRRLAEKAARRIIDRIFEAIKVHAEALAENRARAMGITVNHLVSEPEDMLAEFLWAEKRMQDDLHNHRPLPVDEDLAINDVAGIKVILEKSEQVRVLDFLRESHACEIIEVEPHKGHYNATNLLIEYNPDKEAIIAHPLSQALIELIQSRGLDVSQTQQEFADFVRRGEESVHVEVIISNYQEMLESEIGRCMHEDRIIEQRLRQEYRGHLSKNVEYLMEYLFAFAISKQSKIEDLPIKLWNRYLPDYFEEVVKSLFDIPPMHLDV